MDAFLVVIPLFNKETTIERCILSILKQDYDNYSILVIDDGSTDGSAARVNSITTDKIKLVQQPNAGVSAARNAGITTAIKEGYNLVAFVDADDYWLPHHLTDLYHTAQSNPKAQIIATNYKYRVSDKKFSKTKFSTKHASKPEILKPFFKANYLNSIMTSSSIAMVIDNDGMLFYNENLTHTEDTELLIRAGLSKLVAFYHEISVVIDLTAAQRSNKVPLSQQKVMDFDKYEKKTGDHPGLKKFLDINRFSMAIGHRMQSDIKNAAMYQHKIEPSNLTKKQQQLLTMSTRQLKALKKTQKILGNLGFRIRTGR